ISPASPKTYQISVPDNVAEARIMLYWTDPAASTLAAQALVNDLDLDVTANSITYDPWVLDPSPAPAALNSAAVRARDSLNNMEQVTISNPASGNLSVSVSSFNMATLSQEFYLV